MAKLEQVKSLSEQAIRCISLVSASPLWLVEPTESATEAAADMAAFGFDAAPMAPANSFRYVTAGALSTAQPHETAHSVSVPIHASIVLGAEAPLADAVELLRHHPFFFIQRRREIVGIVTRADLGHAAVSAYAFQSLMAFESGLDSLIPSYVPQRVWLDEILGKESKKILEVFETRKRFNADSTLFDAMMLRHRIQILEAIPALRQDVCTEETEGLFIRRGKEKETRPLDHLRNTLAHGGSILHAFSDPEEAIHVLQTVEKLAQHIWDLVGGREQLWAAYGSTILSWSLPQPMILNGPQAVGSLPFQTPVFGISACNPFDRALSEDLNEQRTQRLVSAVDKRSTRHWIGQGGAIDDSYSELMVFCEGLDYNTALELGIRFGQRAVFQVDAESVSAVACRTGEIIRAWRRQWDELTGPLMITNHAAGH